VFFTRSSSSLHATWRGCQGNNGAADNVDKINSGMGVDKINSGMEVDKINSGMEVDKINSGMEVANILQQADEAVVLEEDPDLYNMAGIPFTVTTTTIQDQQSVIKSSIKQAMSSIPASNSGPVNLRVVVFNNMTNMSGTMNF